MKRDMMMNKASTIFLAASVALPSVAQAQTAAPADVKAPSTIAQARPAPNEAHLAAVREMLDALRIIDVTLLGMKAAKPKDPGQAEFLAYFLKRVTKEELTARYAPAYARHVSAADAQRIALAFRTPVARRMMQYQIALQAPGKERMPAPSAAEVKAMRAFEATPEAHQFADLQRRVTPDATGALGGFITEYHANLYTTGVRAIAARNAERVQSESKAEPVLFVPPKIGISYVDAVMELVANSAFRNAHATWRVDHEIDGLGADQIMAPENLVAPEKLSQSRAALDQIEQKVEAFMIEIETNVAQFTEGFKAINMPGKQEFQRGFQIGLERHVDWSVRFVENQRALVDVMRRTLAFCEARKGQLGLRDGKVLLQSDADVDLYNALVAEIQREVAKGEDIRNESIGRINKAAQGKF